MSVMAADLLGGLSVSRETIDRCETLEALVRRWTQTVNLVSPQSVAAIRSRHTEDSAQIFRFCPPTARCWVDLGSGGGFPGLVVAILAKDLKPELEVVLVEADRRKAAFLGQAVAALGLAARVIAARIEDVPPLCGDVLSARALAPLQALLPLAERHLRPGGPAVFLKGSRYAEELTDARRSWVIDTEIHPSLSQPDAAILLIRKFERAKQP